MMKYKILSLAVSVAVTGAALWASSQEPTKERQPLPSTSQKKVVDINTFPVVEFSASGPTDSKRKARREKHNKSHWEVNPNVTADSFALSIDQVLKNPGDLAVGSSIKAERDGGRVRFPSSRVHLYMVSEQGMPRIGGKYVLFLASTDTPSVFEIVTGYEIRDVSGTVLMLWFNTTSWRTVETATASWMNVTLSLTR